MKIYKTLKRWADNPFQFQRTTLNNKERDRRNLLSDRKYRNIRMSSGFSSYLELSSKTENKEWFYRSH